MTADNPRYERVQIRLASDGNSASTVVIVDGKHIEGIQKVAWECEADSLAVAKITVLGVPAFGDAELEETNTSCPICGRSFLHRCLASPLRSP